MDAATAQIAFFGPRRARRRRNWACRWFCQGSRQMPVWPAEAALVAMARSWAIELAPRGITANVVAPAATETPMLRDPARSALPPRLPPIGRYIRPEEVAATTAFLLGPEAGAITGQQIVICGGSAL